MNKNKMGKYIILGALVGSVVSLFDRSTRDQVVSKSKVLYSDGKFYASNPEVIKSKFQEKTEKYQSMYEQFSNDATYLKEKVDELKLLTPQVKDMVDDTKVAFSDSKEDYKAIVKESTKNSEFETWKI